VNHLSVRLSTRLARALVLVSAPCLVGAQSSRVVAHERASEDHRLAAVTRQLEAKRVTVDFDRVSLKQAIDAIVASAGVHAAYQEEIIRAVRVPVSLHVRDVGLFAALESVLERTSLRARAVSAAVVGIGLDGRAHVAGHITGLVVDGQSQRPLQGVLVTLDGAARGVLTTVDGRFRLGDVSPGTHVVTIKMIGYARVTRQVAVADDSASALTIALRPTANTLDQVVVTGTVVQTALKAVPSAITIITAKQLEERGITQIQQLFRGDVPGLFAQNSGSAALLDEVTMFSRGATALSDASLSASNGTNPIKTYVDGVELADPKYLSQIDPKSIERIEILTGPQASTIYGSNAINGVMQIFTKRGITNTPQFTFNLLSGWIENNFRSTQTPQHDYSAQLSGIEGRLAYNAGGSWNYVGPWTPAKQTTRISGFGGVRLDLSTSIGRATADMTLRRTGTQNQQRGDPVQTVTEYRENGWYRTSNAIGLSSPTTYTLAGQTLGLTLGYAPTTWWSQELGVGQDRSETEARITARGFLFEYDTTLSLSQGRADRRSLRYTTTLRAPVTPLVQMVVTVGADAWQSLSSSVSVSPQQLTGSLTNVNDVSRRPGHNTGGFLQTQFGVNDRLFLTYGLRAEWNPGFGEEIQPNYAPRYGLAYTQDVGPISAKLRGSYGRSTRPPAPNLKTNVTMASRCSACGSYYVPTYGNFDFYLANPELGPEHQQGGEGGLELYWGTAGSLVVTRYNQTVDGLIAGIYKIDSARSLTAYPTIYFDTQDADGYGYIYQYQYLNVGSIRNQGWELQGSANAGPITTKATYSWTKSRTLGVTPKYRAFFSSHRDYPQYQQGATFAYLPEHTWAVGITYARAATTMGVNVTGIGRTANFGNDFFAKYISDDIRLRQNRLCIGCDYRPFNSGYATADIAATHRIVSSVEGVLQIRNVTDHYIQNDLNAGFVTMGRQASIGFRVRFQ
jgi:outer membrane receptor protein involved in Fe transport